MKRIGLLDILRSQGALKLKVIKLFDHLIGGLIALCLPARRGSLTNIPDRALRILVIRPGGIGDAVFLLPVIRELKKLGHRVDVLCETRNAQIFVSQDGLCERVLRYDSWLEFSGIFRQKYDVVVDTEQWHHLSAITGYFISSSLKIGFATRSSRTKLFDIRVAYDLNEYELSSFRRLFEACGVSLALELKGSYQVAGIEMDRAKEMIHGKYIVLALGGSIALRRFSSAQAQEICHSALNKGLGVVLLGGKDVGDLSLALKEGLKDQKVVDLAGKTTLAQSAALIKGAIKFIGHDSGLLHMACAIGIPVVAVFGPGNKDKWGARGAEDRIITAGLDCSPCTRFGYTVPGFRDIGKCLKEVRVDTFV